MMNGNYGSLMVYRDIVDWLDMFTTMLSIGDLMAMGVIIVSERGFVVSMRAFVVPMGAFVLSMGNVVSDDGLGGVGVTVAVSMAMVLSNHRCYSKGEDDLNRERVFGNWVSKRSRQVLLL